MRKFKFTWLDLSWLGMIIILLWLIAKGLGLFNTPFIIQAIPYIGGILMLFGLAKEIGTHTHKLDNAVEDIKELKSEVKGIKAEIKEMRVDIHSLDKRLSIVEMKI